MDPIGPRRQPLQLVEARRIEHLDDRSAVRGCVLGQDDRDLVLRVAGAKRVEKAEESDLGARWTGAVVQKQQLHQVTR
ncbi:MAG: hypothetical protein M0Z30_21395 [Actinomycetota bacterium]|nr:hypothetical protein [Actinomycetota bacterium]